jgi:hypothetical protein
MALWRVLILLVCCSMAFTAHAQGDYDLTPTEQPVLVKDSAGINKIEKEFRLKFSRKPNRDLLVLKIQKLADRSMDFRITNPEGEELAVDISRNRNSCNIDLSLLPAGTYVLNIYDFDVGNVARIKVNKGVMK